MSAIQIHHSSQHVLYYSEPKEMGTVVDGEIRSFESPTPDMVLAVRNTDKKAPYIAFLVAMHEGHMVVSIVPNPNKNPNHTRVQTHFKHSGRLPMRNYGAWRRPTDQFVHEYLMELGHADQNEYTAHILKATRLQDRALGELPIFGDNKELNTYLIEIMRHAEKGEFLNLDEIEKKLQDFGKTTDRARYDF